MIVDEQRVLDYIEDVRIHFPEGFESSMKDMGLTMGVTAFVQWAYFTDMEAGECAEILITKLGKENG